MAKNNNKSIINDLQAIENREAIRLLEAEGRRLKYIAIKLWRKTMDEYSPKKYAVHLTGVEGKRTRNSQRAIKLGKVKALPDGTYGIELTWENELVYHDSVVKGGQKGHAVMLISDGWHSRKLEKRMGRIERFTYFEGTGYLYRVYKEYMKGKPNSIILDTQWSGKYTK